MEPSERPIEIFAPFEEAWEVTRRVLFQPFDFVKWLVIGFAGWLATFFSGGFFNFRGFRNGDWSWKTQTHGKAISFDHAPPWAIPVVIGLGLVVLVLVVLVLWLNSRGRFIFTDCIVRNRAAIVQPWREYHAEGNSYFLTQLVVTFSSMVVFGGLALLFALSWRGRNPALPLAVIILIGVVLLLIALVVLLILKFLVPVMYRQRCGAMVAFRAIWGLIAGYPVPFLLFALFYFLLCIAVGMFACLATCLTCCLTILPYVGTVILLPLVMFLFSYPLCFIRQFGDSYDVWAVVRPAAPPPLAPPGLPPGIPPVQGNPPRPPIA
ncbi:MAG TPA: hypothetical protein VGF73_04825 [Chthoniobacterales bacterium]